MIRIIHPIKKEKKREEKSYKTPHAMIDRFSLVFFFFFLSVLSLCLSVRGLVSRWVSELGLVGQSVSQSASQSVKQSWISSQYN